MRLEIKNSSFNLPGLQNEKIFHEFSYKNSRDSWEEGFVLDAYQVACVCGCVRRIWSWLLELGSFLSHWWKEEVKLWIWFYFHVQWIRRVSPSVTLLQFCCDIVGKCVIFTSSFFFLSCSLIKTDMVPLTNCLGIDSLKYKGGGSLSYSWDKPRW